MNRGPDGAASPSRPDILAARARLKVRLGDADFAHVGDHLRPDETVEMFATGTYRQGSGLLVLTDRRLLFLLDMIGDTGHPEDFPIETISSVSWHGGLMFGALTLTIFGEQMEIKNVNKSDGKSLTAHLQQRLSEAHARLKAARRTHDDTQTPSSAPVGQPGKAGASQADVVALLRELGALRAAGVLTEDEFAAKKAELLRQI